MRAPPAEIVKLYALTAAQAAIIKAFAEAVAGADAHYAPALAASKFSKRSAHVELDLLDEVLFHLRDELDREDLEILEPARKALAVTAAKVSRALAEELVVRSSLDGE